MNSTQVISVPEDFNFWRTVYSHGWCSLPPFNVDKDRERLNCVLDVGKRMIVDCALSPSRASLVLMLMSNRKLNRLQTLSAIAQIKDCLRLKEDFSQFYRDARKQKEFRWVSRTGSGRLLRAPSVFEDVVKMICTTNCSWAFTENMVKNLLDRLGSVSPAGVRCFPAPETIAAMTEREMRTEIRAGYRSPYLLEFSERVAAGKLDVESWRLSTLPTPELFKQVISIKGVGEYATGNILKLLGRYDYLGLDSWVRGRYYELYTNGRKVSDARIEKQYAKYGQWRGLLFWLDMTKHWFGRKFPF
ncbi:MAG: Fe-S cluster assembly protein HesB [bacterium]